MTPALGLTSVPGGLRVRTLVAVLVILVVAGGIALFLRYRARSRTQKTPEFSDKEQEDYHDAKRAALERVLGPMHDVVGHAVLPFQLGGAVDMYYFPNGIRGTGFATMELIEPDRSGPKPNRIGTYELVAFTKHPVDVFDRGIDVE